MSLGEPHTSMVYRNMCIDRPCPSHSRDTDTLHMPTLPCHATLMRVVVNSAVHIIVSCQAVHAPLPGRGHGWLGTRLCKVVVIATRPRTPTMGKRKVEIPTQRTARLEQERDQQTSSYLHFLVGVTTLVLL